MQHVVQGNNIEILKRLPDACIDAVVTDPPYGLSKEPDMVEVLRHWMAEDLAESMAHYLSGLMAWPIDRAREVAARHYPAVDYTHSGGGFMGKSWDSFVPGPATWREVHRVLKPGGHVLSFFGTRTYDLGVLAMRLAGFEVRDQLAWIYGTGFPKSLDVSKAIDAAAGAVREVVGRQHRKATGRAEQGTGGYAFAEDFDITAPATPEAQRWQGYGTALKPAQEPIVLARKPLAGTVAANVLTHGTGGLAIDDCRIGDQLMRRTASDGTFKSSNGSMAGHNTGRVELEPASGRWPANVLFDENAAALLGDNARFFYVAKPSVAEREAGCEHLRKASAGELTGGRAEGSAGLDNPRAGAGRKATARANVHPTVKPIELMRYLVRLITPPGGIVLDPYCGSGTTLCAAALEGRAALGLELEAEYVAIAMARLAHWSRP